MWAQAPCLPHHILTQRLLQLLLPHTLSSPLCTLTTQHQQSAFTACPTRPRTSTCSYNRSNSLWQLPVSRQLLTNCMRDQRTASLSKCCQSLANLAFLTQSLPVCKCSARTHFAIFTNTPHELHVRRGSSQQILPALPSLLNPLRRAEVLWLLSTPRTTLPS